MFDFLKDQTKNLEILLHASTTEAFVNLYELSIEDIKLLRPDENAVGLDINIVNIGLFKYWIFANSALEVANARGHQRLDPSDFKTKTRRQALFKEPELDFRRDDEHVAMLNGIQIDNYDLHFEPEQPEPEEYFRDPDIDTRHWSLIDIIEFWLGWIPEFPLHPIDPHPGALQHKH